MIALELLALLLVVGMAGIVARWLLTPQDRTETRREQYIREAVRLLVEIKARDDIMPILTAEERDDVALFLNAYFHTRKREIH